MSDRGEAMTRLTRGLLSGITAFVIGQQPADLEEVELMAKLAESIENLKPKDVSSDRVNLIQDTYNKSLGGLSKAINNLEGMVQQQGRYVQFLNANMRSQQFQERNLQGQNPVVRIFNFTVKGAIGLVTQLLTVSGVLSRQMLYATSVTEGDI